MFENVISRIRNAIPTFIGLPAAPLAPPQPDDVAIAMSIVNMRRAGKTPADVYKGLQHVIWELDPRRWNARAHIYTGANHKMFTFWKQDVTYGPITPKTKDRSGQF